MKVVLKNSEEFKKLLIKKGLSQLKFGSEVGIVKSYACQIVNGTRNPGPALARKISETLEVEFDDIFLLETVPKVQSI